MPRFGDDSLTQQRVQSAKAIGTILHMHKRTPCIYQGEELGMANAHLAGVEDSRDIHSVTHHAEVLSFGLEADLVLRSLAARSRDNARTPMQWHNTKHAGFTAGEPRLPVNPNYVTVNRAADQDSAFHPDRGLIQLRHEMPVVTHGSFELLLFAHEHIWAFTRRLDTQVLLTVANCSPTPTTIPARALPGVTEAELQLGTHQEQAMRTCGPGSPSSTSSADPQQHPRAADLVRVSGDTHERGRR